MVGVLYPTPPPPSYMSRETCHDRYDNAKPTLLFAINCLKKRYFARAGTHGKLHNLGEESWGVLAGW